MRIQAIVNQSSGKLAKLSGLHNKAGALEEGQKGAMGEQGGLIQSNHEVLPQRQRRKKKTRDASKNDHEDGDKIEVVGKRNRLLTEEEEASLGQQVDETVRKDGDQISEIKNSDARQKGDSDEPLKEEGGVEKEGEYQFEYLDHTADVQLHGWGNDLKQAFEQVALCMFNYMTPLEGVEVKTMREYVIKGHDMESMMYHWLDELLFGFSTELFVPKRIEISKFDREGWNIEARGWGDVFDRNTHASGTEIKAITYSAMQIYEEPTKADVYVIVDI